MNTKTFAQQSRKILMEGVAKKLLYWGFNSKGEVLETPQKISGGYSFRGEVGDDPNVLTLWEALKRAVQQKGIEVVVEEAAYTWFNRLMALRIMAKNGYEPSLLQNAEGLEHTPLLLQKARQGQYNFLKTTEQDRLKKMVGDYSKDQETFALLLVGYCHSNKMLNTVFGKLDDYTELLLPDNMLQDSGFLHLLNTTDAISDEEYKQVELIGWLYQFYISEKKDDVFASFKKGKKAEAKDIPAATQIFTPNWIVKYMVENTVGKIWLDKHPDSGVKANMKYLVENDSDIASSSAVENDLNNENLSIINNVEELTLLDPAVGSGHILVEGFDLLYQMYMEEYYTPEEAVESILKNNLYGLDLDDRAAQLATFAILLKAATQYRDVFTKGWLPNVYAMPESRDFSTQDLKDFLGEEGKEYLEELDAALLLMKQAKNLGSVMKLSLSAEAYNHIQNRYQSLQKGDYLDINLESILQGLKAYIPILLILTKKYAAVVANPPYMGQKSMNASLKDYVNANYPITKSDLMTIFMEVIPNLTEDNLRFALINLPSWLFLSSFEKIRKSYIDEFTFDSLLHMGRGIFGIDFGSVAFAIKKTKSENAIGSYFRLHERNFQHIFYKDIEKLFLYSNGNSNYKYNFNNYRGEECNTKIPIKGTEKGLQLFYPNISQANFSKIPGSPIVYWMSDNFTDLFKNKTISESATLFQGMITGNNNILIREWHEVSKQNIQFNILNFDSFRVENGCWVPYNKGGRTKRWFGNQEKLVNFSNSGYDFTRGRHTFKDYFFKPCFSWSYISSGDIDVRFFDSGFIWDVHGSSGFLNNLEELFMIIGMISSRVGSKILNTLNPTVSYQVENISAVPIIEPNLNFQKEILSIVKNNILFTKKDWDSHEASWNFEQSSILNGATNLEEGYVTWKKEVTKIFFQLHTNEEELNRIFIDIYGLQDELTPEVALKDITILQEELKSKDLMALEPKFRKKGADTIELPINKAEVISQFFSYAIGIFMGRYRLDKPGLHIAHPNSTQEETSSYNYNGKRITIDEDAIIPLMGTQCNFSDDALQRFNELLDIIWSAEQRTKNINFIQECLDKDLERFLVRDFYKYHCNMYKKKPIYWLFASPKGAFQVLVYMHRMNAFTVEKIRANYLLEHLKKLLSEEAMLIAHESTLSTQEAKRLDQVRNDLKECKAYDMELKDIADQQIAFDLDDGVTVNYAKFESVVAKI
jgi:hypothetical protein